MKELIAYAVKFTVSAVVLCLVLIVCACIAAPFVFFLVPIVLSGAVIVLLGIFFAICIYCAILSLYGIVVIMLWVYNQLV